MKRLLTAAVASLAFAAPAAAEPAWMIVRVAWGAGAMGEIREFDSMEDCEAVADHIAKVRTPGSGSTKGVPGAWKFNFSRRGNDRHEPKLSTLCVPAASEVEGVGEGLQQKGWYRDL